MPEKEYQKFKEFMFRYDYTDDIQFSDKEYTLKLPDQQYNNYTISLTLDFKDSIITIFLQILLPRYQKFPQILIRKLNLENIFTYNSQENFICKFDKIHTEIEEYFFEIGKKVKLLVGKLNGQQELIEQWNDDPVSFCEKFNKKVSFKRKNNIPRNNLLINIDKWEYERITNQRFLNQ